MVIASGTPGHAHAYWQLRSPLAVPVVAGHIRALARGLGADLASIDPARILRPPATLNHKRTPPTNVELVASRTRRRYRVEELLQALPAAWTITPACSSTTARSRRSRAPSTPEPPV